MLNVVMSIDTEVYPIYPHWRDDCLHYDLQRDIYGVTEDGEFGLKYQLGMLGEHNLRAVFMIEPLFSKAPEVGREPLKRIVDEIQAARQDIQLHIHPEWVSYIPELRNHLKGGDLLTDYSRADQKTLLSFAKQALIDAGAPEPSAFRAGDYAANQLTLSVLAEIGIQYDSSYNLTYLDKTCSLGQLGRLTQPKNVGPVVEFPISFFRDLPGHYRSAQLAACSFEELKSALERAHTRGWKSFVLVSHSFEFLKNRRNPRAPVRVKKRVLRRFERLCQFLDKHRDRFNSTGFEEICGAVQRTDDYPIVGSIVHTTGRMAEQLLERLW